VVSEVSKAGDFHLWPFFWNSRGKLLMFNHKVHKEIKSNTKAFGDVLMKLNHEDSKAGRNTKEEDIE